MEGRYSGRIIYRRRNISGRKDASGREDTREGEKKVREHAGRVNGKIHKTESNERKYKEVGGKRTKQGTERYLGNKNKRGEKIQGQVLWYS